MSRPLSPIERMIDRATGYNPDADNRVTPPLVTIRCPTCQREKRVPIDKTDPAETAVVVALCPKCDDGGGFPDVLYFDVHGKQLEIP